MKKALIVLAAIATTAIGVEPAMATTTSSDTAVTAAADKGEAAVSKQHRRWRGDRGRWGHGNRWGHGGRRCSWQWRHHRRVRVCW